VSPGRTAAAAAPLRVDCAISRSKKEEIVSKIQSNLDDSMLVFGMRYSSMRVKQMEGIRRALPKEATLYVAKNSLMKVATSAEGYTKWSKIEQVASKDSLWVFVPEEHVSETVKRLNKISKDIGKAFIANKEKGPTGQFSGGVLDGQFLTAEELLKLESMPTRKDIYTKTAVAIKAVPTKLARSIKAIPQKLAVAVKELSDAENPDRTALVGDVFPKNNA
jgi:large subunit ribosomal protein L10